ncbi:DUF5004 domain-containing protein [Algibacter pacificus]|uniref:DUF5004 domain-containing protein n=1 Tax=Algibacter pacificus TaxID=2599389 RepID=UPI0011CCD06B|nr:DUF5004 domain-containing protein [Algibacter pacificus]
MKKRILLVKSLMVCSLLFVSCSDNNDDITCPEAITGELTSTEIDFVGEWTLKSMVSEDEIDLTDDDIENPSTDLFSQYTDCAKDIIYNFGENREYTFTTGSSAVDCVNAQEIEGTWALSENAELKTVYNCSTQFTQIEMNDDNTAFSTENSLQYIDVEGNTIITTTTFTYEKTLE